MTVSELRELIADVVHEELSAIVDPDHGLELRDEVVEKLRKQSEDVKQGRVKMYSIDEMLAELDIDPSEIEIEENVPAAIS